MESIVAYGCLVESVWFGGWRLYDNVQRGEGVRALQ